MQRAIWRRRCTAHLNNMHHTLSPFDPPCPQELAVFLLNIFAQAYVLSGDLTANLAKSALSVVSGTLAPWVCTLTTLILSRPCYICLHIWHHTYLETLFECAPRSMLIKTASLDSTESTEIPNFSSLCGNGHADGITQIRVNSVSWLPHVNMSFHVNKIDKIFKPMLEWLRSVILVQSPWELHRRSQASCLRCAGLHRARGVSSCLRAHGTADSAWLK